MSPNKYFWILH